MTSTSRMWLTLTVIVLTVLSTDTSVVRAEVSGNVFRDYDDGTINGPTEPGVEGAILTLFNEAGSSCQTTSDANGDYTIDTDTCDGGGPLSPGASDEFRLELTFPGGGILDFLEPAAAGGTTVQFVDVSGGDVTGVDVGLNDPADFCEADPRLATSSLVDASLPARAALLAFSESEINDTPSPDGTLPIGPMTMTTEALQSEVGTVWGLAWQRSTESLFSSAFVKYQPALGTSGLPNGPGAIYRTDLGAGGSSLFTVIAGVGTHTGAQAEVGRIGLGDLEISNDGDTLYAINLNTKELVTIPLVGDPPTPGTVTTTALPLPPGAECAAADVHPFALGVHRENLYIGMTCGAPVANLRIYVYEFNGSVFTEKINVPLTYARPVTNTLFTGPATYQPNDHGWIDWNTYDPVTPFAQAQVARSQPWLTDISFDNGSMTLGIRSRLGDTQVAAETVKGGDILRACADSVTFPTTWTVESNGTCGGVTPALIAPDPWTGSLSSASNSFGPGGREYYWNDDGWEGESTEGGLVQIPGRADVVVSQIGVLGRNAQQGITKLGNTSGLITGAGNVFFGSDGSNIWSSNGLGDVEALCEPAPIEIGNRVWLDDSDGIQQPGEMPLAGVTVNLSCDGGSLTASTITDASGHYLFNNGNVAGGLVPGHLCTVRLDNPADYAAGAPLEAAAPTAADQGSDLHDSDATLVGGFAEIGLTIGDAGENDHTYDFGMAINLTVYDFGDAPDSYTTTGGAGGPSHILDAGNPLYLGDCVDSEADGQPVAAGTPADGDDLGIGDSNLGGCAGPDDEDGVTFDTMVTACSMAQVTVTSSQSGLLDGWIDFDANGAFDASDRIFTSEAVVAGANVLSYNVPCSALTTAVSYARFRLSSSGVAGPGGSAPDGEVEDYDLTIKGVDFGDAPDSYGTTFGAAGAHHAVDPFDPVYLGACVDTEADGQPVATGTPADGDDLGSGSSNLGGCAGPDDEDGITFDTTVFACSTAQVTLIASQSALADAWIDFDGNGSFDAGEQIFTNQAVVAGANVLPFSVPCDAIEQTSSYARFRLSSAGGLGPQGSAPSGEVEDYEVEIFRDEPQIGIAKEMLSLEPTDPNLMVWLAEFALTVENLGNVPLDMVQVTADLATAFAAADGFSISLLASADFAVNPIFDGAGDTNLLAGSDSLPVGETGVINLEVIIEPGGNPGPYFCSSTATGESPLGTPVSDTSQDGPDPDPDGNDDATDNNDPTEVLFPLPLVDIPTLDSWALVLLALILAIAAARRLRRETP